MNNFETESILKLTRMLSGEIDTGSLSCDIITAALRISRAAKGYCFFSEEGIQMLTAEGASGKGPSGNALTVNTVPPIPYDRAIKDSAGNSRLSEPVLRHVITTGEDVVMHDITVRTAFTGDPHLMNTAPGSLFCIGRTSGSSQVLLYLEGPPASADSDDRGEQLGMLAAQGAVSLENARRYQDQEKTLRQLKHVRNIKDSLLRYNERIRIDSLQQQINAPFLTTAMNTLRELAEYDIRKADSATIFLGEVFRYITDESFNPVVPFYREWDFVKAYLDFEKLRLFPGLSTSMNSSGDFSSVMVPPLSLQSFIQTATDTWYHGSCGKDVALDLSAARSGGDVIIETRCRGNGVVPAAGPAGIFNTTVERFHHISGDAGVTFHQNGLQDISIVLKFSIADNNRHEKQ
jgi:hypothetical protein